MSDWDGWEISDGAVLILDPGYAHSPRTYLVEIEHSGAPGRYGAHYLYPATGARGGGSSWSWGAEHFRAPRTVEEHLWVEQYLATRRVRELEAELAEARADADAFVRLATVMTRRTEIVDG